MSDSYLERIALALIKECGFREPIREFRFHPTRRWRCDFIWVKEKTILEIEGGVWLKDGRHTTGSGFTADCEKYNEATLLGFKVLRVTKYHLLNGQAMNWLRQALG